MKQFPAHGADKEGFVRDLFAAIAHRYDLMNTLLSFNLDKSWRRFAVEKARLPAGGAGLDVCCGTGMLTVGLAQAAGAAGSVTGLDFCPEMLAQARKNIARTNAAAAIELIEGNAMELPFPENTFDTAVIGFALRNVPDIRRVVSEMRRVVRPGGTVVSLELAKPRAPLFKQLYYLYFEGLLPLIGSVGAGKTGPYQWLPESLRRMPHQDEITAIFSAAGLRDATCHELTGGIVAVHVGAK